MTFVSPVFCMGGVEQWIATLAHWLDPDRAILERIIISCDVPISDVAVSWLPRWVEVVRANTMPTNGSTDLVITWGTLDLVNRIKDLTAPVIDVQHAVLQHPSWQVPLGKAAMAARDRYGVTIAGVSELVRDNFPADVRDSIVIIPNGVDPARVARLCSREHMRARLGIPDDHKVVACIGRICDDKRTQLLVDAMQHLDETWHALVIGSPHEHLLRVGPRVHLIPPQRHIGNLLGATDVLAHPSLHESHGLAVNEAWLAGVPVVSCTYPVNRLFEERHGRMMWLLPLAVTAQQLAGAIRIAYDERSDPRVAHAQQVAREHYTAEVMGRRWSDLIWSLCRK